MTTVLLHGHGLALWISAICSLNGEENGIAMLWHNGIHSVDNSAPSLNTCGAKGGFLLLEYSLFTKGSAEVQSYRKLQGGSFFWGLPGLNWVTHYIKFLPWYSIHVFFPGAWTDQTLIWVCELTVAWVCVLSVCIFRWGNWTVENTAPCCIHATEKGEMRQFTVNSFKQSFRVMVTPFCFVSLESHTCLFTANIVLC